MTWTLDRGGIGPKIAGDVVSRLSLAGRTALVTGGSRGIGRAIAIGLAEAGAEVGVLCRDGITSAEAVVSKLHGLGRKNSFAMVADVTAEESVEAAVARAMDQWGRLDIMVANAGIGVGGPAEDMSAAEWARQMDVNVNGVFYSAKAAARRMIAQQSGNIIVTSSISGLMANGNSHAAYNTSKGAVNMLVRCLANEWARHNIRVNAIAPGFILTDIQEPMMQLPPEQIYDYAMNPAAMKRMGTPDEIAGPAVFLASDAASFITGQILVADGGYTLTPNG